MKKTIEAFSLVELSIVLIIIGLLVSGVSTGHKLIRQSKLRKITTDINEFNISFNTFEMQYDAIPGDMENADEYWALADETNNPFNGDGDESIDSNGTQAENVRYWQHLSLAELVNGDYDGSITPERYSATGRNLPLGPNGLYTTLQGANRGIEYSNMPGCNANTNFGAVSGRDAYLIDKKTDDGIANSGKITSYAGTTAVGDCTLLTTCHTGGVYDANDQNSLSCRFRASFN